MKKDDNKLIKKDYLNKIKLIKKYNEAYYKDSNPIIDDSKYDDIKKKSQTQKKNIHFYQVVTPHHQPQDLNLQKILKKLNIKYQCYL